jgi:hypothetical protein
MSDESNNGIAYLMALKRGASAAAVSPAREIPGNANSSSEISDRSNSHQGPEKRRSPRYKCEGSVQLAEIHGDVRTWATFTDVSLHGCYVEAQATYPVGAALQLKMEANGHRVEATGSVRVSYPYLGMGIAFTELTPENQARLKDLVLSLASGSVVVVTPGGASKATPRGPLDAAEISDPAAAMQAVLGFFRDRATLTREDFLKILRQSRLRK